MKLLPIALKNIRRSLRRSILSGLAISLATFVTIFIICYIYGVMDNYENMLLYYSTGMVQVRHADFVKYDYLNPVQYYVADEEDTREKGMQVPGAVAAVSRIHLPGMLYRGEFSQETYGLAVDFDNEVMELETMLLSGGYPRAGEREAVIGSDLAEEAGLTVGDTFTVLTQTVRRSSNAVTFRVTGIVSFPNVVMTSWFLTALEDGQHLTGMNGGASEVLLYLEDMKKAVTARDVWEALLEPSLTARSYQDLNIMYNYMKIGEFSYLVIAALFVLMGCTVILNTMMMLVYERVKEIGILSSMGFTPGEITRLFFLEAFFIGLVSALTGMILGGILVAYFQNTGIDFSAYIEGIDMDYPTVLYPELSWKTLLITFALSVGLTSLITLIPARKAARMEPVEALAY